MKREAQCPACHKVERRAINYSVEFGNDIMVCGCGAVMLLKNRSDIVLADRKYTKKRVTA